MADSTVRGRFVWHDLITTDIPSAVAFYKKVVGWKTQPFSADSTYLMWVAKSGAVGGVGATLPGMAPHWRTYISTLDIDATINEAVRLGGAVLTPVTDIPNVGRFAVLTDPQGGEFGLFWSGMESSSAPKTPELGEFHWHELATTDYQTAFGFYQSLFGWEKAGEHNMGEMGTYFMFSVNGQPAGGMFNKHPGMPVAWCSYAQVADAAKTAKAIAKAGGKVCNGPMEVPGGSWIVQFSDPQGAMHAVVSSPLVGMQPATVAVKDKPAVKPKVAKKKAKKKKAVSKSKPKSKAVAVKKSAKKAAKKKATKKAASKKGGKKKAASKKLKRSSAKKAGKKKSAKKPVKAKRSAAKKKAAKKKKVARKK